MSVLDDKHIFEMIKKETNDIEKEWKDAGCFCVRFFKNGFEEIVIIDDYFPVLGNGKWAFVRGGEDGLELWPMVLEKAYAKMYGSYNYIEAGKV